MRPKTRTNVACKQYEFILVSSTVGVVGRQLEIIHSGAGSLLGMGI